MYALLTYLYTYITILLSYVHITNLFILPSYSRLDLQSELPSANTGIASTVGTEQVSDDCIHPLSMYVHMYSDMQWHRGYVGYTLEHTGSGCSDPRTMVGIEQLHSILYNPSGPIASVVTSSWLQS